MPRRPSVRVTWPRRGVLPVVGLQLACVGLVTGWFATGHASAPDDGLLQLDVLSLRERVPGLTADRPTMVVLTCPGAAPLPRRLAERFGLQVSTDPALAAAVRLPRATACDDGYVLLDADGLVRYRSYDPDWPDHDEEQEVLLDSLAGEHGDAAGAP